MKIQIIDFGLPDKYIPKRAHYNDAGADVFVGGDKLLAAGETRKIPLGFGVKIPDGYVGFIFPRSGLSSKGIVCELPPIDSGYRGEIHAVVSNVSREPYHINAGDRIGQLVILPCVLATFVWGDELKKDQREASGFGDSGR